MSLRDPALRSWGCAHQYNRWVLLSLFITDAVPGPHVSLLSGRTGTSRATLSPGFIDYIGCGRQSVTFFSFIPCFLIQVALHSWCQQGLPLNL